MFNKDKKPGQENQSKDKKQGPNEKKDVNPSANKNQKDAKAAGDKKQSKTRLYKQKDCSTTYPCRAIFFADFNNKLNPYANIICWSLSCIVS